MSKKSLIDKIIEIEEYNNLEISKIGGLEQLSEDLLMTILKSHVRIRQDLFPEFISNFYKEKELLTEIIDSEFEEV